jgi:peptidoglycan/xylan/chitin deacetylase (PgdA/CDA1 family)
MTLPNSQNWGKFERMICKKNIAAFFTAILLASLCVLIAVSPLKADSPEVIPVKVGILIDEKYQVTNTNSELYQNIKRLLTINKIPFDILNVSDVNADTFLNRSSKNINYAVLLIMSPGWRISDATSRGIVNAAERGMGLVGALPDIVNERLMPLFGIEQLGKEWQSAERLFIDRDAFTFSHKGQCFEEGGFLYLDHKLLPDVNVIARFNSKSPGVWTYRHGSGKSVLHNHTNTSIFTYSGILLQSILYAMPIGVASPINVGVIEVDDFPMAFSSPEQVQEYYYDFYTNLDRWLKNYNFRASFFIAFSYSGNISGFSLYSESLDAVHSILASGNELGLHCGSKHVPLALEYWGSESAIDNEIDVVLAAIEKLKLELNDKYGYEMDEIVSYIAPANCIGDYGYTALDQKTDIQYVGTGHVSSASTYEGKSFGRNYILPTLREFGWEDDRDVYNLPRVQGGFYYFDEDNKDIDKYEYEDSWHVLRSSIESGDAYLIFTHPDAPELIKRGDKNSTLDDIFKAYIAWGDYVSQTYPHYRWWTTGMLGDYLANRQGTTEGEWFPDSNTLKIRLSQPDDAIHVKTEKYLSAISGEGENLTLQFEDTVTDFYTEEYDILKMHQDYFIYPKESKNYRPEISGSNVTFARVALQEPIKPMIQEPVPQEQEPEKSMKETNTANVSASIEEDTPQISDKEIASPGETEDRDLSIEVITSFAFGTFLFIVGIVLVLLKRPGKQD